MRTSQQPRGGVPDPEDEQGLKQQWDGNQCDVQWVPENGAALEREQDDEREQKTRDGDGPQLGKKDRVYLLVSLFDGLSPTIDQCTGWHKTKAVVQRLGAHIGVGVERHCVDPIVSTDLHHTAKQLPT